LFQSNNQDFQVQVIEPDPSGKPGAYVIVDLNGSGLRMSVGDTPQGAVGPTPLALQDTFTWDSTNKWFTAALALNTAAIDTFLGAGASKPAYFEVNLTTAGNRITLLQVVFNLKAVVDELTAVAPVATDQFLTKAECLALFAKLLGDTGQRVVFRSASGVYGRELGVGDNGQAIDNIIDL
jgi:hypothetical protein